VRRYPRLGINRIATKQFLDRGKRQFKLTQHGNEARRFELRVVVVAIARGFVDTGGKPARQARRRDAAALTDRTWSARANSPMLISSTSHTPSSSSGRGPTHGVCGLPQGGESKLVGGLGSPRSRLSGEPSVIRPAKGGSSGDRRFCGPAPANVGSGQAVRREKGQFDRSSVLEVAPTAPSSPLSLCESQ